MLTRLFSRMMGVPVPPRKDKANSNKQTSHEVVETEHSKRLKKINDDTSYTLRNLPFPIHFCDSISYEQMAKPVVIDRGGHALDRSQITMIKGEINPFTGTKMIILPEGFSLSKEDNLNLCRLKNELKNAPHNQEEKDAIKKNIKEIESKIFSELNKLKPIEENLKADYVKVYYLQLLLRNQLEEFVASQERIYNLVTKQGPFEATLRQLKSQLQAYPESTIESIISAERNQALLEELKNFLDTTAEIIFFHSGTSPHEKEDELKTILSGPQELYQTIEQELNESTLVEALDNENQRPVHARPTFNLDKLNLLSANSSLLMRTNRMVTLFGLKNPQMQAGIESVSAGYNSPRPGMAPTTEDVD